MLESLGRLGHFGAIIIGIHILAFLHLLLRPVSLRTKALWAIVLLVPVLGLIVYGGFVVYDPPAPKRGELLDLAERDYHMSVNHPQLFDSAMKRISKNDDQ